MSGKKKKPLALPPHLSLFGAVRLRLVSLDDLLDEAVADDVLVREVDELNALDLREDALGLDEAAALAGREVDLRHVPRNHRLRPEPDARQSHLHLLARRVLRLVEDDESIPQRPSAHEGQGGDFDDALLQHLGDALGVHEVEEGVVEGAEVGVNLLLEVAGEEAEALAGLDRGAREDDAADLLLRQGLHGHRDGEVRLPRAGGADAEDDVVGLDGLDVAALVGRLGRDLLLAGGVEARLGEVVAQRVGAVFGDLGEGFAEFLVGEGLALAEERGEVLDDAPGGLHAPGVAVEGQILTARVHAHVEERFQVLDVLVVDAEERLDGSRRKLDLLQKALSSPSRGDGPAWRRGGRMRGGETVSFIAETTLQHGGRGCQRKRARGRGGRPAAGGGAVALSLRGSLTQVLWLPILWALLWRADSRQCAPASFSDKT